MKINGIAETAIHAEDVARSAAFYQRLFALPRLVGDDRSCVLAVPGNAVFLIFKTGSSPDPIPTPGGMIPSHGGSGHLHFAFKIAAESLESCEHELADQGVAIESKVDWPRGGTSLYFRDPDGHLVELITPGCWEVY
jgi:catechol 2,3-dioxygenase-like lactoylglutathione lyase family enzyme